MYSMNKTDKGNKTLQKKKKRKKEREREREIVAEFF